MIRATVGSVNELVRKCAPSVLSAFKPLDAHLDFDLMQRRLVLGVNGREYQSEVPRQSSHVPRERQLNEWIRALVLQAVDGLYAEGWDFDGHWVNPATAEFLRTEPHPVFL